MLSGSFEYDSEESLAIFEEHLRVVGGVECSTVVFESEDNDRSLAPIDDADVLLVFTRRLNTSGRELERFRAYCAAGRPIVGVRTASHGFQNWLGFDAEVLGGSYDMHYGAGPLVRVDEAPGAAGHPILEGVSGLVSHGSLYRNTPIADGRDPAAHRDDGRGDRARGVDPDERWRARLLHVAGAPGGLQGQPLPPPADQRRALGRGGKLI